MDSRSNARIEVEAARMAVELKHLFAAELQRAAQEMAQDAELVTVEHFRRAVPLAVSRVLRDVKLADSGNV